MVGRSQRAPVAREQLPDDAADDGAAVDADLDPQAVGLQHEGGEDLGDDAYKVQRQAREHLNVVGRLHMGDCVGGGRGIGE